ncbi:MAG TPA: hypothetical protein VJV78_14640 [Polyangiales bacterium]|nr:hypothetical protein [Polyangiales bacterium]
MSNIRPAQTALIARILQGKADTTPALRQAAFANSDLSRPLAALLGKVASHAHSVTDADIAAARAAGLSEDELFELVVCTAIGQASRQYDAALAALDAACAKE